MLEASELENQYHTKNKIQSKKVIFEDFFLEWFEIYKKPNVKDSTYSRIVRSTKLHILPYFGSQLLNEIKRNDVIRWINLLSEKQSYGSVKNILSIFYESLNVAVYDQEIIDKNVAFKIKVPNNDQDKKIKYFTKNEMELFFKFMDHHKIHRYSHSKQHQTLFTLLARTGMRLGEALALNWDDIQEAKIIINKTLYQDDQGNYSITTPKSNSSIRTIKIDKTLITTLKQFKINKLEYILNIVHITLLLLKKLYLLEKTEIILTEIQLE